MAKGIGEAVGYGWGCGKYLTNPDFRTGPDLWSKMARDGGRESCTGSISAGSAGVMTGSS